MMRRTMILPLIFGLVGVAVLIGLGIWQMQRLVWKEGVLADIEAQISAPPVPLPAFVNADSDKYLPVVLSGDFTGEDLRVLVSTKRLGPGHRVVSAFDTPQGRVMIDRGFIPAGQDDHPLPAVSIRIVGNLHWPDETDRFTPAADKASRLWFARDVPAMAEFLGTRPILIVARKTSEANPVATPLPVDTSGIPNDHLGYAIIWFSLAAIWFGMTVALLWRIRRQDGEEPSE